MRPLRVFLCHASQDKPAVRELYNALKAEGWIDPWLDKAKILPGQDWELVIEKAVDDSDVVIVCLSGQSVTKEGFVQREIRYAYDIALEKPEETIFLIPLRLDDCNVPRKLRSLHWVDYFGVEKENAYTDLLEALKLRYNQKLNLEAEETERRQAEEKANREAEEHTRRLAAEQSAREKAIQAAKEKADRESAEKAASEKKERDAREKAARDARRKKQQEVVGNIISFLSSKSRTFAISGLVIVGLLFVGLGGNYLLNNLPATVIPTLTLSATLRPPTSAATKIPSAFTLTATFVSTPTVTLTPNLSIGSTMISEKDEMVLVYVPGGEFTMGSDDGSDDEKPEHQVYLDAFWIDQTEVTNKMFSRFVEETNYQTDAEKAGWSYMFNGLSWEEIDGANWRHPTGPKLIILNDDKPVIHVSWNDAVAYCAWVGRRLPTSAEWEKAARGTDGNIYPWGNTFDGTRVNFCDKNCIFSWADKSFDDGYAEVAPVGNYPSGQSIYKTFDMAGNVWEWVNDWFDENYYQGSSSSNPQGPNTGTYRVLRGGAWSYFDYSTRSTYPGRNTPEYSVNDVGFRCARSP